MLRNNRNYTKLLLMLNKLLLNLVMSAQLVIVVYITGLMGILMQVLMVDMDMVMVHMDMVMVHMVDMDMVLVMDLVAIQIMLTFKMS